MEYTRLLKHMMSGSDVKAAKDRLVELGYLYASTHDTFGDDTLAAVKAFQTAKGLEVDGIVGPDTWAALFADAPDTPVTPDAPSNVPEFTRNLKKGMSGAIAKAEELHAEIEGSIIAGQFVNPANPEAHYRTTAPEIYSAVGDKLGAFVAGAGTFGLSAGLITEHGVAIRLGSVVTTLELPADPRPYGDDPFAWCTRCGACIRRCPAHAIGPEFKDRDKPACARYAVEHVAKDREKTYGWLDRALGCALCQTGVPCEFHRP